jgi:hypothetical protein
MNRSKIALNPAWATGRSRLKRLGRAIACTVALAAGIALMAPTAAQAAPPADQTSATVYVNLTNDKLSLTQGRIVYGSGLTVDQHASTDVPESAPATYWSATGNGEDSPDQNVTFVYQIGLLGAPSGYWVKGVLHSTAPNPSGTCDIYVGDPDAGGILASSPQPYLCDASDTTGDFPGTNETFLFNVHDNVAAEVQGIVSPTGPVSLDSGYYDLNTPHFYDGSLTVPANTTTHWDSILRSGDNPIPAWTASGIFVYRIVDDGQPTPYWVEGLGQNYRGVEFDRTSTCNIYDHNPTPSADSPGPSIPVNVSPYRCDMTSQDIGYRGNWEVTYSISKRPLQVVTGAFEQADLMNQFCADDETNCGLTLASATKVLGPAEQASSKVANNGTTTVDDTVKASRTVTTTNSVGIKVTVTAGISKLITTSVSVSYNFSIANSTTYTQSQKLTIPPGMEAWWTMRAEMVRVVGDVVIRDGDTYYLLKNVSYDFPEVGGFSVLTAESSPIGVTGGEPGAPGNPGDSDPVGSNPGANAPDSALTATSADAARLANTGSSVDGTPYLLGLLALLTGAGLVLIRGGRSSLRRSRRLGFGSSNRS